MSQNLLYAVLALVFLLVAGAAVALGSLWSRRLSGRSRAMSGRLDVIAQKQRAATQDPLRKSGQQDLATWLQWVLTLAPGLRALDALIMRVCDVMLSLPSILIALLIDGVGRAMFPNAHDTLAFLVLILAISLTGWVQYARTVRGTTMVERNKEYVQAARVIGVSPYRIMVRHVLPNAMVATLTMLPFVVSGAIGSLATLDFLGFGLPAGSPSLGELLAQGKNNPQSPWLGLVGFGTLALMLSLWLFIGEAVRDAFDPRRIFVEGDKK